MDKYDRKALFSFVAIIAIVIAIATIVLSPRNSTSSFVGGGERASGHHGASGTW